MRATRQRRYVSRSRGKGCSLKRSDTVGQLRYVVGGQARWRLEAAAWGKLGRGFARSGQLLGGDEDARLRAVSAKALDDGRLEQSKRWQQDARKIVQGELFSKRPQRRRCPWAHTWAAASACHAHRMPPAPHIEAPFLLHALGVGKPLAHGAAAAVGACARQAAARVRGQKGVMATPGMNMRQGVCCKAAGCQEARQNTLAPHLSSHLGSAQKRWAGSFKCEQGNERVPGHTQ
jgi:hypothetical protein